MTSNPRRASKRSEISVGTTKTRTSTSPPESMQVRLKWPSADELPIQWANLIFARFQDGQFLLTFGHYELPHEIGLAKETKAKLREDGAVVKPIARIAFAPTRFEALIEALTTVHQNSKREAHSSNPTIGASR